jgi:hypothetical protein
VHVVPEPQVFPQTPQLFGSVFSLTHMLPHGVVPPGQAFWQEPPVHAVPEAHTCPHAPQLFRSVLWSTHRLAHKVLPVGQLPMQTPPEHTSFTVFGLPSSHGVPSDAGGLAQVPGAPDPHTKTNSD